MTDEETDALVLGVLAGQSADYLIHPSASAFFAVGLDEETVTASLARLEQATHARQDEVVVMVYATDPVMVAKTDEAGAIVLDKKKKPVLVQAMAADGTTPLTQLRRDPETGEPVLTPELDGSGSQVTIDAGWCITDAGKATVA